MESLNANQFIYNPADHFWAETVSMKRVSRRTWWHNPWRIKGTHWRTTPIQTLIPASAPSLKLCRLKPHGKIPTVWLRKWAYVTSLKEQLTCEFGLKYRKIISVQWTYTLLVLICFLLSFDEPFWMTQKLASRQQILGSTCPEQGEFLVLRILCKQHNIVL